MPRRDVHRKPLCGRVNHWYMAMTLKGMTADDLQLVPAFVAFAEDSWGIPITNRLGINVSNSALH